MLSYDFFNVRVCVKIRFPILISNHTNQQKFLALVQNGIQASNSTQS